ncbi:mono/diheme cytochrome c family protein [Lewinella marina]|uniref:Cytochrome C n=1 Tax=Neolewinella marina TaxID=438751 RepID=A0A2G0CAZ0_9BACT|nr:cytochrome c [Neolewinella marina]NJB84288.1 mono/diheme cytochrome c family protein [Neolewinella marina]PHK97130.1 cytochrome C [Neolewinella marina]
MSKKILKIGLYLLAGLLVVVTGVLIYVSTALPAVDPAPDLKVELTPERVARGEYLANYVMSCTDCHSPRDWSQYAAPLVPHSLGRGGEIFDQQMGLPGRYVSANLTPAHLGDWTDGEIFRAITSGVSRDGRALFPIMPYPAYGKAAEEDIHAVIAYLRTLPPIDYVPEPSRSDFPMNFIINTIPQNPQLSDPPDPADRVRYGEYLVNIAACAECHTKQEGGQITGKPYAGGTVFPLPNRSTVTSANLTPHPSGLGNWTEDQFVARFKQYRDSSYQSPAVGDGDPQTIMPWMMYSQMKEEDLRAIYAYLRTLEPVDSRIQHFQASLK